MSSHLRPTNNEDLEERRYAIQFTLDLRHKRKLEMVRTFLGLVRPDMVFLKWEDCVEFLLDTVPIAEMLQQEIKAQWIGNEEHGPPEQQSE